jgi:hypothetical protein
VKLRDFKHADVKWKMHGKYPAVYISRKKTKTKVRHTHMKMSKFKKLQVSLEKKGKGMSKDEAGAIAANAGREKYGAKGMARKAAFGRGL